MQSRHALSERLARDGFAKDAVQDAVACLVNDGYVDDQQIADSVVREAIRVGRGPRWVLQTMRKRMLDDASQNSAMDKIYAEEHPLAKRYVIERNRKKNENIQDIKNHNRWLRHLMGRGFSFQAALAALKPLEDDR